MQLRKLRAERRRRLRDAPAREVVAPHLRNAVTWITLRMIHRQIDPHVAAALLSHRVGNTLLGEAGLSGAGQLLVTGSSVTRGSRVGLTLFHEARQRCSRQLLGSRLIMATGCPRCRCGGLRIRARCRHANCQCYRETSHALSPLFQPNPRHIDSVTKSYLIQTVPATQPVSRGPRGFCLWQWQ